MSTFEVIEIVFGIVCIAVVIAYLGYTVVEAFKVPADLHQSKFTIAQNIGTLVVTVIGLGIVAIILFFAGKSIYAVIERFIL